MTVKISMHGLMLVVCMLLFTLPNVTHAETKEIITSGTYIMEEGESLKLAQERALLDAKRAAVEQASLYLESYAKTVNMELASDEVQMLAAGLMQVTVLQTDKKFLNESIQVTVTISAQVSTEQLGELRSRLKARNTENQASSEDKLKDIAWKYNKLLEDYDKQQQEFNLLKEQLKKAANEQKKQEILQKIGRHEQVIEATIWINTGDQFTLAGNVTNAIDAYSKAIDYNPDNAAAYNRRGSCYLAAGLYAKAVDDFSSCIKLYPRMAEAYFHRSQAYLLMGEKDKAAADKAAAMNLNPLPLDLHIIPPASDIAPENAAFSGKWIGVWGNEERTENILVFESISDYEATILCVDTKRKVESSTPLYRIKANILKGEVMFSALSGRIVKLKMNPDGTMRGSMSGNGRVYYACFSRMK